ncbi:hypothetical protein ACOTWI_10940, partial [Aliarcobacter butzleri]
YLNVLEQSIREPFRMLRETHKITDLQMARKYIPILGVLAIQIDTTKCIIGLREEHILNSYNHLRSGIKR